jgi:allophanate hydrolase
LHPETLLAAPADQAHFHSGPRVTETIAAILAAHRAGTVSPAQTVARSYQRIREHNDPAIFISLRDEKDALAEAEALTAKNTSLLPLYGIPVAVKDNIDVAGLPTARRFPICRRTTRPRWRGCARPAPS